MSVSLHNPRLMPGSIYKVLPMTQIERKRDARGYFLSRFLNRFYYLFHYYLSFLKFPLNAYRIHVAFVSVIEMGVQMFLRVKGLAAEAASPLRGPVLVLRLLLRSKDISTFVEWAFQRQLYLILLQYWHPSLKPRHGLKYCLLMSLFSIIFRVLFA